MPVRWSANAPSTDDKEDANRIVDWTAVWDKDAGIFAYGWDYTTAAPHAFYMVGCCLVSHFGSSFLELQPHVCIDGCAMDCIMDVAAILQFQCWYGT
jgi:hypothetical protein